MKVLKLAAIPAALIATSAFAETVVVDQQVVAQPVAVSTTTYDPNAGVVKNTTINPNLFYSVKSTAKHILEQNDIISYTLTVKNNSNLVQFSNFEIDLTDTLKYADLLDGGDYKVKGKSIYWNTELTVFICFR